MKKTIINTMKAPEPIGPYNQAVIHNGILFSSGQIAVDPFIGELITGNIEDEAQQVMENIKVILKEAEMDFSNVLKSVIYITDINNFGKINEVYGSYFGKDAPAREVVQAVKLPKNANIEISVIAAK